MKLIIERDDGKIETFQDVVDLYIAVRQLVPYVKDSGDTVPTMMIETRSFSWGQNLRELLKELRQSTSELDAYVTVNGKGVVKEVDKIN